MFTVKWVVVALMIVALQVPSHAADLALDDQSASIKITKAWSRPTGRRTMSGVIYLSLSNHGDAGDTLLQIESEIAETTMLHTTTPDGNISRMEHVDQLAIAPGETITFAPGGYHIMLMALSGPIKKGDTVPVILTFEKAGEIHAEAIVGISAPQD